MKARFFSLSIPKSQNNDSCLLAGLEKLGNWCWFISNHDSDITENRINEESSELSRHSLAIVRLEETGQTPGNSLNTSSAFDSAIQALQREQDL